MKLLVLDDDNEYHEIHAAIETVDLEDDDNAFAIIEIIVNAVDRYEGTVKF